MSQVAEASARDYTAISPSAKSLLLLKGLTSIPFAKATAELVSGPGSYDAGMQNTDFAFWKRVVHFEDRYWSVDQLMAEVDISNILELSSGFSFRGLQTVNERAVHYVDSDLADVIHEKQVIIPALQNAEQVSKGVLEMQSLNALDEDAFRGLVSRFPAGPILIVNEGLMMYLNNAEKEKLCSIIYNILQERGGYWITADIYVKTTLERFGNAAEDDLKELIEKQRIEDNMFESIEAAKAFFNNAGFEIESEAKTDRTKLSSLPHLISNASEAQMAELTGGMRKVQTTWRLSARQSKPKEI